MTKTKREKYNEILALDAVKENAEMVEFIEHEIELLNKKRSSSKETARQKENSVLADRIIEILTEAEKPIRLSDIQKHEEFAELTSQRIAPILANFIKEGKVVKTKEKKITYYSIA